MGVERKMRCEEGGGIVKETRLSRSEEQVEENKRREKERKRKRDKEIRRERRVQEERQIRERRRWRERRKLASVTQQKEYHHAIKQERPQKNKLMKHPKKIELDQMHRK